MMIAAAIGAAPGREVDWHSIDWAKSYQTVRRLQARIAKAVTDGRWNKVKALQWLLTHSFSGNACAVRRVIENKGHKTPGVDKETWNTPASKTRAVMSLSRRGYQPQPLRRVYIPKANGKQRPLGIPTMKDRAMQALHLSALEPVAETTSDPNSYGFRRNRACRDAAEQLFLNLAKKTAPEWVLDADIAGCFDNISHEWLIANIPMDKKILGSWLKTGFVENQQWFPTEAGTPQGGIISPTLANMTLNGMEKAVKDGIAEAISIKEAKKAKVNVVRYADDFIITGATPRHLAIIVSVVEGFLGERGLTLSPEKTRTAHIDDGFDFLGWNIRKYGGKLLIKPAKRNVQNLLLKVRGIIKGSGAMPQAALIGRLNPIIRGWANYHAGQVSKNTYSKVDNEIWQGLWKWAGRRHPTKNTQWIKNRYFHREGSRSWVFGIKDSSGGRTVIRSKLLKAAETPIRRHIKIKAAANPFDPAWETYFEARETATMKKSLIGRVKTLWEKQDGKCSACNQQIREGDEWHVHHKIPKYLGGDDTLTNLVILHPNCHRQVHAKYKLDELPAL